MILIFVSVNDRFFVLVRHFRYASTIKNFPNFLGELEPENLNMELSYCVHCENDLPSE